MNLRDRKSEQDNLGKRWTGKQSNSNFRTWCRQGLSFFNLGRHSNLLSVSSVWWLFILPNRLLR